MNDAEREIMLKGEQGQGEGLMNAKLKKNDFKDSKDKPVSPGVNDC